jgi:uncharacterized membrane protein YphA (DoxX/SURF4 family)
MIAFRHLASWLLAFGLAAFFLHVTLHPWPSLTPGYVKFYDLPGEHLPFAALAERSGVSAFEPAGRMVTGVLELIAALLVLIPFSRRAGAGLSLVLTGAAVALHLSPWLGREISLPEGGTDGGTHFLVYVVVSAASILLLVVHPGRINRYA